MFLYQTLMDHFTLFLDLSIHQSKMTHLLKLLYAFQFLYPLTLLKFSMKALYFYLGFLQAQGQKSIMFAPKFPWGLVVPYMYYYLAANKTPLTHLCITSDLPLWAHIDISDSYPIYPSYLLWIAPHLSLRSLNPILLFTLRIWDSIKYSSGPACPFLLIL